MYQLNMLASFMKLRLLSLPLPFLIFLIFVSAGYLWGVPMVPFHPDESTQLFTSGDLEIFWQQPADVFWMPEREGDLRQFYRELDAPLTRNLIGIGRLLAGLPAPEQDWNWSQTWQENQQSGALPDRKLLLTGRLAVASLFPFSLLFLFLTARTISNEWTAWISVLLLASNALVLLHTRRAMAESVLFFTTILTLWAIVRFGQHPWLIALPAALAFASKQSLAALAPAGLVAVLFWTRQRPGTFFMRMASQAALYSAAFLIVVLLWHPFTWKQPYAAILSAIEARQELSAAQTSDRPEQVLDSPGKKLIAMVSSIYLTPPWFAETSNYQEETRAAEDAYLANPLHRLFRSIPAGAVLLILSLFGFAIGVYHALKGAASLKMTLLIIATLFQATALLALILLPWQRYYMPLIPFSILWTAYGLSQAGQAAWGSKGKKGRLIQTGEIPDDSYKPRLRQ